MATEQNEHDVRNDNLDHNKKKKPFETPHDINTTRNAKITPNPTTTATIIKTQQQRETGCKHGTGKFGQTIWTSGCYAWPAWP